MQKDFMLDTWEDVKKRVGGKKVFLFGAGYIGHCVWKNICDYNSPWNIIGFLDNDLSKQNKKFEGLNVFSPNILNDYTSDEVLVLICCLCTAQISKQLYKMGIRNYYSVYHLDMPEELRTTCVQTDIDVQDIEWLVNRVEDDQSRELVKRIVDKRKVGFFDYTDLRENGSEYFIDDFFNKENDEVFVDGGGYDGDTIEEFIEWTKNRYKKILKEKQNFQMILSGICLDAKRRGISSIYVTGTEIESIGEKAIINELKKELAAEEVNLIIGKNILCDSEALLEMSQTRYVILAEETGCSKYQEIIREMNTCQNQSVDILGSIVFAH